MNALCYKIVFSKRLGSLVAVGEHTAGQGKAAGTGIRAGVFPEGAGTAGHAASDNFVGLLKSVFASVALSCLTAGMATAAGPAANTLPTGYKINNGNVAISTTGTTMTINQATDKASVNWQSFSIGSGAAVNVVQNNANSVLLNRVVGNDPSQIFGKLTANGQVILINPNGVVFGKDGSVTASAFTASTFGMTDADFLAGKHKFTRNGSTAGVTVEEGARIDTTGYVALVGASVDNQGAITTKGGPVVLASGESVTLPSALTDNIGVPLSGKVRLELLPSTINAMVANSGTITTEGGQVLMQAAAVSDAVASITHTGTIDTTGVQGGAVTLQADHGIIKATGSIKANSYEAKNKGGDIIIGRDEVTGVLSKSTDVSGAKLESLGGFVETSGDYLETKAVSVKAKDWLLDPTDIAIVSGTTSSSTNWGGAPQSTSSILASDINFNLNAGTSVIIETTGTGSQQGNIAVNESISKTADVDATLTLKAHNNISVAAGKSISSTSNKLNVVLNSDSDGSGAGAISMNSGAAINTGASIISNGGNITMVGGLNATGFAAADGVNTFQGIYLQNATINAGAGNIVMKGVSPRTAPSTNTPGIAGILMAGGSITTTGTIDLTGNNQIGGGSTGIGFRQDSGTISGGTVTITGDSRSSITAGSNVKGVTINGTVASANSGIEIIGYGGQGVTGNYGVVIGGQVNATNTAKIQITGTAGAGGSGDNVGVNSSGAAIISSVDGNINIKGTGGIGNFRSHGVFINNTTGVTSTGSGNITVRGEATNSDNGYSKGVIINGGGLSTKTGTIKIDATVPLNYQVAAEVNAAINAATGNVYIRSTGGKITNSSTGTISGKNVSIDNSGGSIADETTGVITNSTAGASTWAGVISQVGVDLGGSVTATNNLNIYGNQTGSDAGVRMSGASTIVSGKNVNIVGKSVSSYGVLLDASSTLTGGNVMLVGNSTTGNGVLLRSATLSGETINATGNTTGGNGFAIQNATIETKNSNGTNSSKSTITGNSSATVNNDAGALQIYNGTNTVKAASGTQLELAGNATATTAGISGSKERGIYLRSGWNLSTSGDVTLRGTSNNSDGIRIEGTINDQRIDGVTNKLTIEGKTSDTTGTVNGVISVGNITTAGTLKINADKGAVTLGNPLTEIQAATGITITAQEGNLTINQKITNSTSGDVILGAGVKNNATEGLNSNVKTASGFGVSNSNGKTFIYTGSVAGTGLLSNLTSNLTDLNLSSFGSAAGEKANTVSHVAYTANNTAAISDANGGGTAQVFFREAIGLGAVNLGASTTVTKTYGDVSKTYVDHGNLTADVLSQMKVYNASAGTISKVVTGAATSVKIKTADLIDALSIAPTTAFTYSTSDNLKANTSGYGYTIASGNTYNVSLGTTSANVVVNKKTITVSGLSVNNKTYDGTKVASVTDGSSLSTVAVGSSLANDNKLVAGDNVSLTGTAVGTYDSKDVAATGNKVTFTGKALSKTLASGADDASNYNLVQQGQATGDGTITAKTITVSGLSVNNKTYDGTKVASVTDGSSLSTVAVGSSLANDNKLVAGDNVSLTGTAVGTYDSKDVAATGNKVTFTGKALSKTLASGADDASNYNLVQQGQATGDGTITAKTITVSGLSVNNKTYDGTKVASVTDGSSLSTVAVGSSLANDNKLVAGDNVSLTGTAVGTYDSKDVAATGNKVTFTGKALSKTLASGADDASNYNLVQQGQVTGDGTIAPKSLTAIYAANNKVFDGNTTATLASAALQDKIAGDVVTPTNTSATFDTAAVGTDKTVTVAGIKLTGKDAANYTVAATQTTKANITAAAVKPPSPVVPTDSTPRVKIPVGSANPFALASAEDLADDTCSANSIENCHCESSPLNANVDICYEPKAGAKGTAH